MSKGFLERWMDASAQGSAIASSTSKLSLLGGITGEIKNLPSGYFERIGKSLRIRAAGRISTVVTTPGTLQLGLSLSTIDVWLSGLMTLNVVAKTNVPWVLDVEIVCRTIGNSTTGKLIGIGTFVSEAVLASVAPTAGGELTHVLPYNTAPAVGNGFDTTIANPIDFSAQWSVSNAANSISLETFGLDIWT